MNQIKKPGTIYLQQHRQPIRVDHVITNNSITRQTKKRSKKYTTEDQFNQPTQAISKSSENFDITPVNLESIHHFLIVSNHNEEKKSLSPQLEPVANKVKLNTRNNNEKRILCGHYKSELI